MAKETWLWLVSGLGFGAVNAGELLEAYPEGAEAVWQDLGSEKLDEILTQKQADKLASTRPADYALPLTHAESRGIYALPYDDPLYPDMLRSILNPPLLLFVKGDLTLLNGQLTVGMVGARRPSGYGVEAVKTIGRGVALGGAIIVSGLAAGLDSEAHKAALAVNGPTIACIAFGHDNCYPAQNRKLMEVIERYGAVISEYTPGTKPEKPYFLHRNRLIAGLAHALVVTEARKNSGTMSTVNFATDYGRDVFAVPGSIFSDLSGGTNAMIRDGAYLAASARDILTMYGVELSEEELAEPAAEKQAKEGRPQQASATPPWQASLRRPRRQMERQTVGFEDISPAEVKRGEQTLLEALQREIRQSEKSLTAEGRVSRGTAIDAFRRLQNELPPTEDSELDARNRALDEMVAAVTDDVEIGGAQKRKPPQNRVERQREMSRLLAEQDEKKVKPFRWESVERLTKEEVAQSEAEAQKRRQRQSRTAAVETAPYPVAGAGAVDMSPVSPVAALEPVAAVPGVSAVAPANMVPPAPAPTVAERIQRARPVPTADAQAAPSQAPPTAAAPEETPARRKKPGRPPAARQSGSSLLGGVFQRENEDLAGKLRTMQKPPEEEAETTLGHVPAGDAGVYSRPLANTAQPARQAPLPPTDVVRRAAVSAPPAPRPILPSEYTFPAPDRVEDEMLDTVSDAARQAYEQLGVNPTTLADISEHSGLSPGEAMAALTELELAGLSRQLPGRRFVIMQ